MDVGGEVAELLGDAEVDFRRVNLRVVPVNQVLARSEVLGDGLLGEDMLACCEGGFDELRLRDDGQRDDDGFDVWPLEQGGVGAGGVVGVELWCWVGVWEGGC